MNASSFVTALAAALVCAACAQQGTEPPTSVAAATIPPERDLQGIWTTATLTPLERPAALADRASMSPEEMRRLERDTERALVERSEKPPPGSVGGYNREWLDPGMKALPDGRTSLIVDPPDGRIPWRPEAKAASDAERARYGKGPYDSYMDLDTGERCISDGVTLAPLQPYNMNYQIFQTPEWLAIAGEMYHEYRLIPLDCRPHVPAAVGPWLGDGRGRWEGDTLVVVSRGFADKSDSYWAWPWRGARPSLTVTERFRRVDASTVDYRFTIEDPAMFTRPWTVAAPMTTDQASRGVTAGPLFEYACHEGNYALPNVLRGAREEERQAAASGD